jgi:hypothetical protein
LDFCRTKDVCKNPAFIAPPSPLSGISYHPSHHMITVLCFFGPIVQIVTATINDVPHG